VQLFMVGICMGDEVREAFLVGAMVLGEPSAGAVDVVLWRNGGFFHGDSEESVVEEIEGSEKILSFQTGVLCLLGMARTGRTRIGMEELIAM